MVGRGRAALSRSRMIWRWSQTPLFPAQRTSSAKPSRSPRTSKSYCELLRRTNTTGQNLRTKEPFLPFVSCILHPQTQLCSVISHFCLLFSLFSSHSPSLYCAVVMFLVSPCPPSLTPLSRPCEREGVRRLRHSLGCFSTLVPWAEKVPTPLQPLSLRPPDPTSWYSGLCPCLPGTVLYSSLTVSVLSFFFCSSC